MRTGLRGLETLDPAAPPPISPITSPNPIDEYNERILRFQVSLNGSNDAFALDLDLVDNASLTLDNLSTHSSCTEVLSQISQIEKSTIQHTRVVIIMFGQLKAPLDIFFVDQSTRDCFCDLIVSLNPTVVIKLSRHNARKWVCDENAKMCMRCSAQFSFSLRRHHCRSCGFVVCHDCSSQVAVLPNMGYVNPVRVCDYCFDNIVYLRGINTQASVPGSRKKSDLHGYGFAFSSRVDELMVGNDSIGRDEKANELARFDAGYKVRMEAQRRKWDKFLALHVDIMSERKVLGKLVKRGIPPELRGNVWQALCGTHEKRKHHSGTYYQELISAGELQRNHDLECIEKDLHRTFPTHVEFGSSKSLGVPVLRRVLLAYSQRNKVIGYCQSMNFICALLLLFMAEEDAFWTLSCIIEDILTFNDCCYYQEDLAAVRIDQHVFKHLLREQLPLIDAKLESLGVGIEPLTIHWFLCLYVNCVPVETTLRIWDVLFLEGPKMILRAGLTLMSLNEHLILRAHSSLQLMTFLKAFTRSALNCEMFIRLCFDYTLTGPVSDFKVQALRAQYKSLVIGPHLPTSEESVFVSDEDGLSLRDLSNFDKSYRSEDFTSWPLVDTSISTQDNLPNPITPESLRGHFDQKYQDLYGPLSLHLSKLSTCDGNDQEKLGREIRDGTLHQDDREQSKIIVSVEELVRKLIEVKSLNSNVH